MQLIVNDLKCLKFDVNRGGEYQNIQQAIIHSARSSKQGSVNRLTYFSRLVLEDLLLCNSMEMDFLVEGELSQ